jgi:hypothetical protein
MPKIYKLAMSPNAQYAAFILFEPSRGQKSSMYITRLDWLEGVNSVRFVHCSNAKGLRAN